MTGQPGKDLGNEMTTNWYHKCENILWKRRIGARIDEKKETGLDWTL